MKTPVMCPPPRPAFMTVSSFCLMGLIASTGYSQVHKSAPTDRSAGAPHHLVCEYFDNPLGLDIPRPRLSWQLDDGRRGACQTAYHVVVATDPGFEAASVVWDTGKVDSGQSVHVPYDGRPLTSRTRYHWKVRTWDAGGQPSPWSEMAHWEMALLEIADWKAKWISTERPVQESTSIDFGNWIWAEPGCVENGSAYIRCHFEVPDLQAVAKAMLHITVDDRFSLYLNGATIGERAGWNIVSSYDVTQQLRAGHNVIAIKATNGPGDCGATFSLRVERAGGPAIELNSSSRCLASSQEHRGWTAMDFDDSGWGPAFKVADYGSPPWNELKLPTPPREAVMMRKSFTVDKPLARARAYACGLGIYELRLNGDKVGNDIFTPGWTHYHKRLQYQPYDITDQLQQGENVVGAILGNGWWSGGLGWKSADQYSEGDLRMLCQIHLEYADGSSDVIVTDDTWKAQASPIIRNTYYHGESYDARRERPGWDKPGHDAADWWPTSVFKDAGEMLVAQRCETIQVTDEIEPMQISEPQSGVFIFDFGQNAAGWARLKVLNAEPGTRIRLRFGEEVDPNGELYRENYRSAEATDYYFCKGGESETWEPSFTYRGYRYCEVTGLPNPPTPETLTMVVVHSATEPAGTFECSHWLVNRILHNVQWGLRSNLHSVPTDCPQRDERLGWMGDAQTFAASSCYLRDMASFYTKWMRDIIDSQNEDGAVSDVSPAKVVRGAARPGWGDAVVIMPYVVYRFYGDTRIIEENYEGMKAWVEYMRAQSEEDLYETDGYGDWVAVVESPKKWIGSAFYCYSTMLLSEMADVIGKEEDARQYRLLAQRIARAFNEQHFDQETGNYVTGTQTCNLLPVFFGITPSDRIDDVMANVANDIRARGNHLSTGFMGTAYLMSALADYGYQDLACVLATQTTYPSWGHMILNGATTIWERWDTDKRGPQMNSRNHFMFGVVVQWFFEDLAGIDRDPAVPGFKKIVIRPRPCGEITWARAAYPSLYGEIESSWRIESTRFHQSVTIPPNTTATIFVPLLDTTFATLRDAATNTRLLVKGRPADAAPGLAFLRFEDNNAVFDARAGHYEFTYARGDE